MGVEKVGAKMMARGAISACLCVLLLTVVGCSTGTGAGSTASSGGQEFVKKEPLKIGYSVYDMRNPYWQAYAQGVEDAAKEAGYRFVLSDQKSSQQAQVSGSADLISQGVSAVIVSPVQPAALPATINAAHAQQIPLIVGDVGTKGDHDAFILSDNVEGGRMAARYMVEKLGDKPGKKEVSIIALHPGSAVGVDRVKGFRDEISKHEDFEVVSELNGNDTEEGGFKVTQDSLSANPGLDAVYAANDSEAAGAVQALQQAGKSGVKDVLVTGFDGNAPALKLIEEGKMAATIAQDPYGQGQKCVEMAIDLIEGRKVDFTAPEEKTVNVPVELVDPDNLDEFRESRPELDEG